MKDSRARSISKGITWRITASADTFLLALIIFGTIDLAAPIAATEVLTKIFLYFLHERVWNFVRWGREAHRPVHVRSLTKGVSWRFFGAIDTFVVSYLYSGSHMGAFKLGGTEVATKLTLYYLHERAWALTSWGREYDDVPARLEAEQA